MALAGCGGGTSGPQRREFVPPGRLIAEQRLSGPVRFQDTVLTQLEAAGGVAARFDSDRVGVDSWQIDVNSDDIVTFGVSPAARCEATLTGPSGASTTVRSGETVSLRLRDGRHVLRLQSKADVAQSLWVGPRPATGRASQPGIYIAEITDPPELIPADASTPVFIGAVTKGPVGVVSLVTSHASFRAQFDTPDRSGLDDAVRTFFANGGQVANIVGIATNAPAAYPNAIAALDELLETAAPPVVAADASRLSFDQWAEVQNTLLTALAGKAMVVIDPALDHPDLDDAEDYRRALDPQVPNGAMYFPFLGDPTGRIIAPSGAVVGVWSRADVVAGGPWSRPAGAGYALAALVPKILLRETQMSELLASPDRPINPIRRVDGVGTAVWGERALGAADFDQSYIHLTRLQLYLELSLKNALEAFVFCRNTQTTWEAVTHMFTVFLNQIWLKGALVGDTAASAFAVLCGLGESMTADDILTGRLIVIVRYAPAFPAEYQEMTFEIQLQTS